MHLSAYAYFLDRGEPAEAADAVATAERFCRESELDPPADWYPVFVFADAYLRHDPVAARAWWDKLEPGKSSRAQPDK